MTDDAVQGLIEALRQGHLADGAPPEAVRQAVQALADAVPLGKETVQSIRSACKALNRQRAFALARQLGQAWRDTRGVDLTTQRLLAQAVINLSALDEGERLVQEGLKTAERLLAADKLDADAAREAGELRGLLGRIAKQRFADGGMLQQLDEAVRRYLQAMAMSSKAASLWPGVNALALLHRREREQLPAWPEVDLGKLAGQIERITLNQLKQAPDDPWLAATLSECRLARWRGDDAELWLYRFMLHPTVDAFALDAYDRQLREIWQGSPLRNLTLADRLEQIMARHLLTRQSRWSVSPAMVAGLRAQIETNREGFEKNFSGEHSFGLDALQGLLRACASIGCVSNRRGERLGTGFLLRGEDIKSGWGDDLVFVTNAHVIGTEVDKAIAPADALVSFEVEAARAGQPAFYAVTRVEYSSAPAPLGAQRPLHEALDVTVVRLQPLPAAFAGLAAAKALPLIDSTSKAFVVGHPSGGGLQISLHDSQLLDLDDVDRLVHYRTPTEPGSSGSPVFNAQWQVMAVHHGGSPKMPRLHGEGFYQSNEGISLLALRAALAALGA